MSSILQGTTPTLTITIPSEISVSSIEALELAFKHMGNTSFLNLSDVVLDGTDNTVSVTMPEDFTLSLDPSFPLYWQLRIGTANGIFGTPQARINIEPLISTEALS